VEKNGWAAYRGEQMQGNIPWRKEIERNLARIVPKPTLSKWKKKEK